MNKKRVNISIGEKLHEQATQLAHAREMDFSEFLSHLLRNELMEHYRMGLAGLEPTAPPGSDVQTPPMSRATREHFKRMRKTKA